MQTVAELDLPFLPLETPEFSANPYRFLDEARTKHPWLAKSNIGLVVHEFRAIRDLFNMDDKFRPAYDGIVEQLGAQGTPWGRFTEEQMISLPVDKHRLLRDTFAAKFTPRFANQLRPMMQRTVKRLLDEWVPKGTFDFEEMASFFPISVMFTLVGAPVAEIANVRHSLETLGLAFSMDKTRVPALQKAYQQIEDLVRRLIADRRAKPNHSGEEDLLDLLINTSSGGAISDRQLEDLIIFFFIAGYDTSKNVLTYTMYTIMQHPEIYERCGKDHDYCRKVLEEGLRYFNPGSTPRFTNEEIPYRDVLLPKDAFVIFTLNLAGRDPITFEDPHKFDPDRKIDPDKRHVAFGLGKHICLGQHIARAQLQEALHQIPQRIRHPRLAGEYGWRPYPGTWGLKGLPITYDAT